MHAAIHTGRRPHTPPSTRATIHARPPSATIHTRCHPRTLPSTHAAVHARRHPRAPLSTHTPTRAITHARRHPRALPCTPPCTPSTCAAIRTICTIPTRQRLSSRHPQQARTTQTRCLLGAPDLSKLKHFGEAVWVHDMTGLCWTHARERRLVVAASLALLVLGSRHWGL
jgi:hypothetical protein